MSVHAALSRIVPCCAAALLAMATLPGHSAQSLPDVPEVIPSCAAPQLLNLPSAYAGPSSYMPGMVFNGTEFATAYAEGSQLRFVKLAADGSPIGAYVQAAIMPAGSYFVSGGTQHPVTLVWNGNGYAATFHAYDYAVSLYQVYFVRLNRDGVPLAPAIRVSNVGTTPGFNADQAALVWLSAPQYYIVAWRDNRNGAANSDLFGTSLDASGAVNNGGLAHDINLTVTGGVSQAGNQSVPRLLITSNDPYSPVLLWQDARVASQQIYSRQVNYYDLTPNAESVVTASSGNATEPFAVVAGNYIGLAWIDTRNGNSEIYFRRLYYYGGPYTAETRMTNDVNYSGAPVITWIGSEYGLLWVDYRSGTGEYWFQRLGVNGTAVGGNVVLSTGLDAGYQPALAYGRGSYLFATYGNAVTIGCAADTLAPSCPASPAIDSVGKNTAALSWDPAADPDGEIAFYEILRDGVPVGKSAGGSFVATGLTAATAYEFRIQAVDTAQRRSPTCPTLAATTLRDSGCSTERAVAPPRSFGTLPGYSQASVAANATDFAALYVSVNGILHFQRLHPDGRPNGATVDLGPATYYYAPAIVWTGSQYGIAWHYNSYFWFNRLNASGAPLGAPVQLDTVATPDIAYFWPIALAYNGSSAKFAVAWSDSRNTATSGIDVFATILNSNGTIAGPTNNFYGIPLTTAAGNQTQPTLARGGSNLFVAVWEDGGTPLPTLQKAQLDAVAGTADAPLTLVTPLQGGASRPQLAYTSGYLTLVWSDTRDGNPEIYSTLLNGNGTRYYSSDTRISNDPAGSYNPSLAATVNAGESYVYWNDQRDGEDRIYLQRLNYASLAGPNVRLMETGRLHVPRGAFSQAGHLVAAIDPASPFTETPRVISAGCPTDATPPSCPLNLQAGAVSSSQASFNWLAASDPESGIAEYAVIRDNLEIGRTPLTQFTDPLLGAGTQYRYQVRPVNGAGTINTACTAELLITTPGQNAACSAPSAIRTAPLGAANTLWQSPVVWTGSEFASVYVDRSVSRLFFQRLFPDGSPNGARVDLAPATGIYGPGLVWNGTGFGVAWMVSSGGYRVQFVRLNPDGTMIGAPVFASAPSSYFWSDGGTIQIAWSGSGYGVAWTDLRAYPATNADIYATLFNADGTIAGPTNNFNNIPISIATGNEVRGAMAWSGGAYQLVWQNYTTTPSSLYTARLDPAAGTATAPAAIVQDGSGGSVQPHLAADPYGMALVWVEYRSGTGEVYFLRLNTAGNPAYAQTRIASSGGEYHPVVVHTGLEFGVFWNDGAGDGGQIFMQRVLASGQPAGGSVEVTQSTDSHAPMAAYGAGHYLVSHTAWGNGAGGPNQITSVGCIADPSAPTCPGNLLAYNVSGTQATLSWSPAGDPESGLSHYVLYRNNAELARTTAAVFTDTGLALGSPYNYMVQPVNARGVQNLACTASIYVKTSSSLTLTMNKASADAILNWTNANLNSYTIFRGNSPQVMTLIGSTPELTAPDPNVLIDGNSYFYTVDDPGQE